MKLRDKTLTILGVTIISLGLLLYFFTQLVFMESFNQLDENRAYKNLYSLDRNLKEEVDLIDSLCRDYAERPEIREIGSKENLGEASSLSFNLLDRIYFLAVLGSDSSSFFTGDDQNLEGEWQTKAVNRIRDYLGGIEGEVDFSKGMAGHLAAGGEVFMVSIYDLPNETEETRRLAVGKILDDDFLKKIASIVGYKGRADSFELLKRSDIPNSLKPRGHTWVQYADDRTILASKTVQNLAGEPAFIYKFPVQRASVIQGRAVIGYFICFLLLSGVVLTLIIIVLLERNFFVRLARLGERLTKIGMGGDLSERLEDTGNDEISKLTRNIDSMLLALQRSARELYGSEHRFRELFNNIPSGVAVFCKKNDGNELVLENINAAGQEMDGVVEEDVAGKSLLSIYPELRDTECYEAIERVWETGTPIHLDPKKYDGDRMNGWREFQIYKLPSQNIVVLYDDVTERMETGVALTQKKHELHQSQKMEAIGRLAGGIAHDFNNILTVVNGVSEIVLMTMEKENPIRPDLEEINRAGERAADLTEQLLAFSRKQVMKPEIIDLNEVVKKTKKMLNRLIGEDIELIIEETAKPAIVKADTGQMEQVLMNLAVNSRDAMPEGGRLEIATAIQDLDSEYISRCVVMEEVSPSSGKYVVLQISDNGKGMDAETVQRICDPFFTTKGENEGTGLGLSTSYGIVRQSNGYMWFDSELGKGTKCTICLPCQEDEGKVKEEDASEIELLHGDETILFAEDEDDLRKVTKRFLEYAGFNVLVAANGDEALAIEAEYNERIDLLLADVVMPGINGPDLADKIKRNRDDLKVVYITGYSDKLEMQNRVEAEGDDLLKKPFNMSELVGELRRILDK